MRAAVRGRDIIAQELLKGNDVNPNRKDPQGWTPLAFSACAGHDEVVKLLLDLKTVHPDPKNSNNRTPLFLAAQFGHGTVVKLLLERGCVDPASKDNGAPKPLMIASLKGHHSVVRHLLEWDSAYLSLNSPHDCTSLTSSATMEHVVELLLSCNCIELEPTDEDGWTSQFWEADVGLSQETIGWDSGNDRGTSLGLSTEGHKAVVKLLIEYYKGQGKAIRGADKKTAATLLADTTTSAIPDAWSSKSDHSYAADHATSFKSSNPYAASGHSPPLPHTSTHSMYDTDVCVLCKNLFLDPDIIKKLRYDGGGGPGGFLYHPTLRSLETNSSLGCLLCWNLLKFLKSHSDRVDGIGYNRFSPEDQVTFEMYFIEKDGLLLILKGNDGDYVGGTLIFEALAAPGK